MAGYNTVSRTGLGGAATAAGWRRTPWCRSTPRSASPACRCRSDGASTGSPSHARRRCRCSAGTNARSRWSPAPRGPLVAEGRTGSDRQVDGAALVRLGERTKPVETVVRVWRRDESDHQSAHLRTRSRQSRRRRDASDRRARTVHASSPSATETTSPSRWIAAEHVAAVIRARGVRGRRPARAADRRASAAAGRSPPRSPR